MRDYQESVTTGQTDRQTPDKVIPMCCYASQATQKAEIEYNHPCLLQNLHELMYETNDNALYSLGGAVVVGTENKI